MQEIRGLFDLYMNNMNRNSAMATELLIPMEEEEWIELLKRQAKENADLYEENAKTIQEIQNYCEHLDEEVAEALFDGAWKMYNESYHDCEVLLMVFHAIRKFYEEKDDFEKLILIDSAIYYEEYEVQNYRAGKAQRSMEKPLEWERCQKEYSNLQNERARYEIFNCYYNYLLSRLATNNISLKEGFDLYKKIHFFWESVEVQLVDGANEQLKELMLKFPFILLLVEHNIDEYDDETKDLFCRLAIHYYDVQIRKEKTVEKVHYQVHAAYLHALCLQGKITYEEITKEYADFFFVRSGHLLEKSVISTYEEKYLFEIIRILIQWMKCGCSKETQQELSERIIRRMKEITDHHSFLERDPYLDILVSDCCASLVGYLDGISQKERLIFSPLIRRQLPTYLHSVMVAKLARVLTTEVYDIYPELFATSVNNTKESAVEFVYKAALCHDVGKTKVADVVNSQCRRLNDFEFDCIRQHPIYGSELAKSDTTFAQYKDVIIGHHKFYDGTAGYPVDFDNTTSPDRVFIDIVTICDCIDAATDNLGRNYKSAKDFYQILKELEAGSGTRYNPYVVECLSKDISLQEKMEYITNEGRCHMMYQAYENQGF